MTAVFAGAFDPFTLGHKDIVVRAAKTFGRVIVAVAVDADKHTAPIDVRVKIAQAAVKDVPDVTVTPFGGLLTDFCKTVGDCVLVRGVRGARDLEYERDHARIYSSLGEVDMVCFICAAQLEHVSSTVVRTLVNLGASTEGYVVKGTEDIIKEQYALRN